MKLYVFRTVPLSIIRSFSFASRIRMEPCSILILLASCQQICMTYHCYVYSEELLMVDRGTV